MITPQTLLADLFGDLPNNGAIVTGGGSGIGRSVCEILAAVGMRVAVADIKFESAVETATLLAAQYGVDAAMPIRCDVTKQESVAAAVDEAASALANIRVLVNSAGIVIPDGDDGPSVDETLKMFDVNTAGSLRMIKAVEPHLIDGGSIVQIGSVAGMRGIFKRTGYCVSKGGVHSLVQSESLRIGPKGIRINGIAPGRVFTNLVIGYLKQSKTPAADFRRGCSTQLSGTMGFPDDVAKAVLYLASHRASRMANGGILDLSDGWSAGFHPDASNMPPSFEPFRQLVRTQTGLDV